MSIAEPISLNASRARHAAAKHAWFDLSVIVISHGHESLMRSCVGSLAKGFAGLNVQIVLLDNLAVDGFAGDVDGGDASLKVLTNDNPVGFAANVNRAVAESDGQYIFLLNPDTEFRRGRFVNAIDFLEQTPDAGILGLRLTNPDGSLQPSYRRWPTLPVALGRGLYINRWPRRPRFYRERVMEGVELDSPAPVDWVTGATMLFRREDFLRVGGMDAGFPLYYEDVDLCYRFAQRGLRTYYYPELHIMHEYHRGSAAKPLGRNWRFHAQSMWRFFTKHGYAFNPAC